MESPILTSHAISSPSLNSVCTWVGTCENANSIFGLDAIALVKQNEVGMALTQYSDKLRELEKTLPKLDHIIEDAEAAIDQKMARVNVLEKQLNFMKRDTLTKMKFMEELQQKKELFLEEIKRLKRKTDYCQEKQNQLVNHFKKVRMT